MGLPRLSLLGALVSAASLAIASTFSSALAASVSVTGVSDGATYTLGSVPTPGCSATEVSLEPTLQVQTLIDNGGGLGQFRATCSGAEDFDGRPVASASATYTVIPSKTDGLEDVPPTVEVLNVTNGASYFFGTEPVPACQTNDEGGGIDTFATLTVTGGNGNGRGTFTATCDGATNNFGTPGAPASVQYSVYSPPIVTVIGVTDGANYSLGAVPVASCLTENGGLGVKFPATLIKTGGTPFGTGLFTVNCVGAQDFSGLVAPTVSASYTVTVGIPTQQVMGITDGGVYTRGQVPPASCVVTAAGIPIAVLPSLTITGGDMEGLGSFTATCDGAKDALGQIAEPDSVTFTVVAPAVSLCGVDSYTGSVRVKLNGVQLYTVPVVADILYITNTCAIRGVNITTVGGTIPGAVSTNMAAGWKLPVKTAVNTYSIAIQSPALSNGSLFMNGALRTTDASTKMSVKFLSGARLYFKLTGFVPNGNGNLKTAFEIETPATGLQGLNVPN